MATLRLPAQVAEVKQPRRPALLVPWLPQVVVAPNSLPAITCPGRGRAQCKQLAV